MMIFNIIILSSPSSSSPQSPLCLCRLHYCSRQLINSTSSSLSSSLSPLCPYRIDYVLQLIIIIIVIIISSKSMCQEEPLSLSCLVMSFCEWTMSRGGIANHDLTLVGRHSFFSFFLSFFFFFFVTVSLTVLLGLAAERQGFSGCGRQQWYIQCPLGVAILFIIYALSDNCSKTACVVRIRERLPDRL